MNKFLKTILKPVYHLFVDKYSFDNNTPLFKQVIYTTRYRLAGRNIFLTPNERKIASLKNIHAGQRCFIIGNGPSLNKIDLTYLKNEITFGVNAIYLNYSKMQFHPTYYVIEDMLVAEDRSNEINNYHGPKLKLFGAYLNYTLKKDTDTVFVNIKRNYSDKKFPLFSENSNRFLGVGGSVTYVCMQLAFFLGFKEVFLIGFDHNYIIPNTAKVSGTKILSTEEDPNHFSKAYFGRGYRWHDPNVERIELGFKKAKEHFEKDGRTIYNATPGGNLEIFNRVNYDSLFSQSKGINPDK